MHKLGIIVPYRNRYKQLVDFKKAIKRYLEDKEIDYELIIVEQDDGTAFNRGKLLNVGFIYAKKYGCDYVVFHDIDMIPTDVDYSYSDIPLHLAVDLTGGKGFKRIVFDNYFGGVTMFPVEMFEKVNGYSNLYWGWGYEDDDLMYRCIRHGLPMNNKKIPMIGSQTAALKFNGKDAYVRGRNVFKHDEEMTIFVSFYPDDIECDIREKTDKFSIFSIPGYDFTITYNSFRRYTVEVFNDNKEIIFQMSEIKPNYKTNIAVTINPDKKKIKFYQDGELVSEEEYDYLYNYVSQPYFYLGCGDPERYENRNYYRGLIDEFAIWNKVLPPHEISEISLNQHYGLSQNFGSYTHDYSLNVYYHAKFIKNYQMYDLSGNRNHGYINRCEITEMNFESEKEIIIPYRRTGSFRLMTHDENGFVGTGWKHEMTRYNELRYHNEVTKGYLNNLEDGLSDCKFHVHGESKVNNVTQITVGI